MLDRYISTVGLPLAGRHLNDIVKELRAKLPPNAIQVRVYIFLTSFVGSIQGGECEGLPVNFDVPTERFPEGTVCLCYTTSELLMKKPGPIEFGAGVVGYV